MAVKLVSDGTDVTATETPTSREEILNRMRTRIVTEWVPVPEWDAKLLVRAMNAGERDSYDAAQMMLQTSAKSDKTDIRIKQMRANAVAQCTINPNGSRYFESGDIHTISIGDSKAVGRLFAAIMRLSTFTAEDQTAEVKATSDDLKPDESDDIFST